MKYAVQMGSDTMVCIPSFIKTNSGIQKLIERGDTQKHRHTDSTVSHNLLPFQNKNILLNTYT
jgi:hypothetical protein